MSPLLRLCPRATALVAAAPVQGTAERKPPLPSPSPAQRSPAHPARAANGGREAGCVLYVIWHHFQP